MKNTETMKLSDLKPCAKCGLDLFRKVDGVVQGFFVVLRPPRMAMLQKHETGAVLGLNQMFGGRLGLAEVFAPGDPIQVVPPSGDFHVCAGCYLSDEGVSTRELAEWAARRQRERALHEKSFSPEKSGVCPTNRSRVLVDRNVVGQANCVGGGLNRP